MDTNERLEHIEAMIREARSYQGTGGTVSGVESQMSCILAALDEILAELQHPIERISKIQWLGRMGH